MDFLEFRESYINEDIKAEAINSRRYPIDVFIENAADILKNDYSLLSDMEPYYYELPKGTKAFKSMRIDGAYLDLSANTLNLIYADFNESEIKNITNDFIKNKKNLMLNFFENVIKGFFVNGELADPVVTLARDIRQNESFIYKIHLFIVSTDRLSNVVKNLIFEDLTIGSRTYKVDLDVLDMEGIWRAKQAGFQKEDIIINCEEFGIEGIPCIKAEIETDQYESYLAIVPGEFLASIYKKYSSSLLESNVRSFLKFNGGVNKGIRGTILNEKSRFFTYNNGISTTAKEITVFKHPQKGMMIRSFKDLQIINGGQTTATLAATSIKHNADLSGIYVQMKLTVLKDSDPDLIRNIATYANSQNKVKTADLNSSHPFYVQIENFSRKLYAPLQTGEVVQTLWFFERARGQYEQPLMQMTKKQAADYKLVRPKKQKFTLTDMAKYINASIMMPHYVSWGGEVNAAHFHNIMVKQWERDKSVYNELFYKEIIARKILFAYIEQTISEQEWYQERRAYRPQLVAYTFSKLVHSVMLLKKNIDYKKIWDLQKVPEYYYRDVALIAKIVFDSIYDENRSTANVETYCKKEECWNAIKPKPYCISSELQKHLISPEERKVEEARAKKDQKFADGISDEISIFNKGAAYWKSLQERGLQQQVIKMADANMLENAIHYCNLKYLQLSKFQLKEINRVVALLKENGIE